MVRQRRPLPPAIGGNTRMDANQKAEGCKTAQRAEARIEQNVLQEPKVKPKMQNKTGPGAEVKMKYESLS